MFNLASVRGRLKDLSEHVASRTSAARDQVAMHARMIDEDLNRAVEGIRDRSKGSHAGLQSIPDVERFSVIRQHFNRAMEHYECGRIDACLEELSIAQSEPKLPNE